MNICDDVFNSNMARGEDVEKQVTCIPNRQQLGKKSNLKLFSDKKSQNKSTSSQLSVKLQLWGTIAHSQLLAVWTSRAGEFCHNLWLMWVLTILLLSLTNMKIFKRWLMTIFPAQPQKTSFERGGSRDAFESEETTGRTSRRWNKAKVRGSEIMCFESI